jgi:hypothetical protein
MKQLEKKLKTTSDQVKNIISNFEAVHGEMNDLKQEYIQSLEESKQADSEVEDQQKVQLEGKLSHKKSSEEALKKVSANKKKMMLDKVLKKNRSLQDKLKSILTT